MHFLQKLLPWAIIAAASPLDARNERCCDVPCYKALDAGAAKGYDAKGDCSSYQRATTTPCPATTTKTVTSACATTTVTAIKRQQGKRADEFAGFEARNAGTCGAVCAPTHIPKYAAKACKPSDYHSACSCLGYPTTTVTAPRSTVTKTTTKCSGTVTVTAQPTITSTLTSHTSSSTGSTCSAQPTASACGTSQTASSGRVCQTTCGVDRPGGDYSQAHTGSLQACIDSCSADPQCVSASYHEDNGYCYYKNSANTLVSACGVDVVDCGCYPTTTTIVTTATQTSVATTTVTTTTVTDTVSSTSIVTQSVTNTVVVPTSQTLATTIVTLSDIITVSPTITTEIDTTVIIATVTATDVTTIGTNVNLDKRVATSLAPLPTRPARSGLARRDTGANYCSVVTITSTSTVTATSTSSVAATATAIVTTVKQSSVQTTLATTQITTVTLTETDTTIVTPIIIPTSTVTDVIPTTVFVTVTTTSSIVAQPTCTSYNFVVVPSGSTYDGQFIADSPGGDYFLLSFVQSNPSAYVIHSDGTVYGQGNTFHWVTLTNGQPYFILDVSPDEYSIPTVTCSITTGPVSGIANAVGTLSCSSSGTPLKLGYDYGFGDYLVQDVDSDDNDGGNFTPITLAAVPAGFC